MNEQMLQQIQQLVMAAMQGDQQAQQLIQQVMQAALQGDPQAQQVAQIIQLVVQQMQGQAQMARNGAKFLYIKSLKRGGCPACGLNGTRMSDAFRANRRTNIAPTRMDNQTANGMEQYKCGGKKKLKKSLAGNNTLAYKCGGKKTKKCAYGSPIDQACGGMKAKGLKATGTIAKCGKKLKTKK